MEALVGPVTVDTMPPETYAALRGGAQVSPALFEDVGGSAMVIAGLARLGISIDEVTAALLADGIRQFAEPFDRLLATIAARSGVVAVARSA